ncbi:MAG: hypothetical protein JNM51_12275 [Bacteroidia bacterium]|nr:hypothetical protein [Bacteroidia bacterium]
MKHIFKITAIILMAITLTNCKKDKDKDPEPEPAPVVPTQNTGNLEIYFEAMVGDSELVLSTSTYTNLAGNAFNVTAYKYYISNIKITKSDNSIWSEPNSYHIVDHADHASTTISLANVPYGSYKAVEFVIGVDSAANRAAGTGALDPANGMCWGWNQGYIFAKFEGTISGQNIKHHIGGWNATVGPNNIKTVSPSFGTATADVSGTITPKIHIVNNLLQWFESPTQVDFTTFPKVIMSTGTNAKTIADNYADMFTVDHIHND